ncbi:MAG TPA: tandem-95 repeat protein, partial [Desulfocapsa sulfexigens]|nr:tandem-95 repeat protein [Desulfocapsa sulfexigens]
MPADNTQGTPPSNPIGNQTDTSQQDWLDISQPGETGETLKAKKWTTQRSVVDDSSHHGNIHTGTEKSEHLNKSVIPVDSLGDRQSERNNPLPEQPVSENSRQESGVASQPSISPAIQGEKESAPLSSEIHTTADTPETVVTGAGSDPLRFEERPNNSPAGNRLDAEGTNSIKQEAAIAEASSEETVATPQPTQEEPIHEASAAEAAADPAGDTSTDPVDDETDPEIIDSTASAPVLATSDANGLEDSAIAINFSSQLTDTDGSETLSITISGVPEGASLSAGTDLGNGEWQLEPDDLAGLTLSPPTNSDEDFSLTITATSTEANGGQTNSISEILDVFIEASADAPVLESHAALGDEDTAITLNINAELIDTDGSESLSDILITGVPEGANLSSGTANNDGSWSLSQQDLNGLTITPPPNANQDFELNLSVTTTDSNGSTATTHSILPVSVTATTDEAVITGSGATLTEDSATTATGTLTISDPDADEEHFTAETIQGQYGSLELNENGSWSYTLDNEAPDVQQLTPNDTVTDTISITSADGTSHDLVMTINGSNDAPVITNVNTINVTEESMEGFSGYGEIWKGDVYSIITQDEMLSHLGISDVDSNAFTVSLADADTAWHDGLQANDSVFISDTLASDSVNGDETVIQVTQEFLDNYPTVDAQVGDFYFDHVDFDKLSEGEIADIKFSVQVSDGEGNSEPRELNIRVTGSNDAPEVTSSVTLPAGTEDTSQLITVDDLLANTEDIDANDTLSVSNVSVNPEHGTLTSNPDGTFTFTPRDNYNGEVTISYNITDGIETVPATASINLTSVNDGPIATDDVYEESGLLNSEHHGDLTDGASRGVRVTGIYAQGSEDNLLEGKPDLFTLSD